MVIVNKKHSRENSKPIYYKTVSVADVEVDETSRVVKFYAAIWGNIDDAGDILVKGCCARSIEARGPASTTNRKIKFLWQHDVKNPLGLPSVLKEDDRGLYAESPIDEIPDGDRAITQMKSGTLNQFSIGYMYVWDKCEWTEVNDPDNPGQKVYALVCKEIELFELSVVTFGCNEETEFLGMKSNQLKSELNQLNRDTNKLLKSFDYEMELQLRQLIRKHIALAQCDPDKPPLPPSDPQKGSVDYKSLLTALKP